MYYCNKTLKKSTYAGEENGTYIQSTYYPDGSQKSVKDRYRKFTYYNYDSRGRVSSVQSDSKKVWYEYDSFDRVTKEVIGTTPDEYSALYYVTYDYSDDGRTVTVTEGGKYKTVSELDALGANYLNVTDEEWTKEKNYEYLKEIVTRKDDVKFSCDYDPSRLDPNSTLAWEIQFLEDAGYQYIGNNTWSIK